MERVSRGDDTSGRVSGQATPGSDRTAAWEPFNPMARVVDTAKEVVRKALPIKCLEAVFLGLYLTSGNPYPLPTIVFF